MSSSHLQDGKAQQPLPVTAPQESQPQYAHGGHSGYTEAQPEPVDSDNRPAQASDALVMLQLASFEGRAL